MTRILLSIALFFFAAVAAAADITRIDIVTAGSNPNFKELAETVQHKLQEQALDLPITVRTNIESDINTANHTLLINIGEQLLPWSYSDKNYYAATINFYISSITTGPNAEKRNEGRITALYRDQPLSRQLRLAKLLLPNLNRVAILRGTRELIPASETLQHETQLTITEVTVEPNSEWPKLLSQSLRDNDVLLGIDDSDIYNSDTIRGILLTAYRHGKGLIGPSRAFVNAGSLASCYTTPEQYLQQLTAMVTAAIRDHHLPRPQYPMMFGVAINKQVATSLNLSIPDENTLSARLQNQNGECGNGC